MREHDTGKPTEHTARTTRRASLMTLGGVALAASALHLPVTEAKKNTNRARKTCRKQVAGCREQLSDFCVGDAACEADLLPCCSPLADCQADEALDCAYAYLEQ